MHQEAGLVEQQALVFALQAALQSGGGPVAVYETHISWVLVAGSDAYKIKKAVRFDFLDFSTLEKRRHYCDEELRLNQRLAPGLYVAVLPVSGTWAEPYLAGRGEPIEYAVKMHAFAQGALWRHRVVQHLLEPAEVDALAQVLAGFHLTAPRAPPLASWGSPAALGEFAEQNFAMLEALADPADYGEHLRALRAWQAQRLRELEPALAQRKADGWVRECHGDLHLGNILTLDDRVMAFDCIEFNDALRWIDVMHELAFPCMDLRQYGRPELAARLRNAYLEATGDYDGVALLRYYEVDCALVRAKIALGRARQAGGPEAMACRQRAGTLVASALAAIHAAPPTLVVMHGYAGSGKSSVARRLVELLDAVQLRSDVERKRMHGIAAQSRPLDAIAGELYGPAATAAVYARLGRLAAHILESGYTAIVDACSLRRDGRDAFAAIGAALGVPVVIVDVRAPEATLRARIGARLAAGVDPSDANEAVLDQQLRVAEPPAGEELARTLVLDSAQPLEDARLCAAIRALAP